MQPAPHEARRLPGVEGVWVFVLADMSVFAVMFGCFMWDRRRESVLFEASSQALNRNFGGINTLILLTGSMLVVLAIDALKSGRTRAAPPLLGLAAASGLAFVVSKTLEYHEKLAAGLSLLTNDFFMYYFIMTGMHLGHVVVGTVVLAVLARKSRSARAGDPVTLYESGATYWHMVDLLWIFLFPLLYLLR